MREFKAKIVRGNKMKKEILKLLERIIAEEVSAIASEDKLIASMGKLQTLEGKLEYARKFFNEIGEGSSRQVFELPSGKVLKVALNPAGIDQNRVEVQTSTNPSLTPIMAKIFVWDKGYEWLIVERVTPFETSEEFSSNVGISYSLFRFIIGAYRTYKPAEIEEFFKKVIESLERDNERDPSEQRRRQIEALGQAAVKNFLKRVIALLERGTAYSDLIALHHWGLTGDNRVVTLDYGADKGVIEKHYGGITAMI